MSFQWENQSNEEMKKREQHSKGCGIVIPQEQTVLLSCYREKPCKNLC